MVGHLVLPLSKFESQKMMRQVYPLMKEVLARLLLQVVCSALQRSCAGDKLHCNAGVCARQLTRRTGSRAAAWQS